MVVICVPVLCAPYIMQKPQRKRTIEKKTTFYCSWPFMIGGISHVEWQSVADLYLMKWLLTFLPLSLRCLRCGRCWVCLSWCPSRALVTDTTRPGTENIVQQDATRCNQQAVFWCFFSWFLLQKDAPFAVSFDPGFPRIFHVSALICNITSKNACGHRRLSWQKRRINDLSESGEIFCGPMSFLEAKRAARVTGHASKITWFDVTWHVFPGFSAAFVQWFIQQLAYQRGLIRSLNKR